MPGYRNFALIATLGGHNMLASWVEILPLFVVRWLAIRYCERLIVFREEHERIMAVARPDVYIKIKKAKT